MSEIRTVGELRGFLTDVLVGIREGKVDVEQAKAIAKVAAQITSSLAVEVNAALQLEKMGKGKAAAGSMLIANGVQHAIAETSALPPPQEDNSQPPIWADGKAWCEQCEMQITRVEAGGCKSKYCSLKVCDDGAQ